MAHPKNSEDFAVSLEDLLADLNSAEDSQNTVSEATGAHRSNLKAIIENRGYHKGAFADFRKIHSMSDTALADYWRTFRPLLDVYEPEINSRIQDMVDKANTETADMEDAMGAAAE